MAHLDDNTNGEATLVAPRLWQGSRPLCGSALDRIGFDVVVLSAMEHQLSASCLRGVKVILAALDDSGPPPTASEIAEANEAAQLTARYYVQGDRVLITCWQGRNRSGLITALVLREAFGMSGKRAIEIVKAARPTALENGHFYEYIAALPRKPRLAWSPRAFERTPSLLPRLEAFAAAV